MLPLSPSASRRALRVGSAVAMLAGLASVGAATAAPPTWSTIELQARSNIGDGWNLPAGSSFNSGTPALNARGRLTFRLIVVGGTGRAGLWLGGGGSGGVVYQPSNDHLLEDPTINAAGRVAFEQFDLSTDGIFVHDPDAGTTTLVVPPGGPFGLTAMTRAGIADDGTIGFRGDGALQRWIVFDGAQQIARAAASGGVAYLFSPAFSAAGRMAGKVRLGGIGNEFPDEIRVYETDGSFAAVVRDRDADAASPFSGFDNSVSISDDGGVAFVANLVAGGRGVFVVRDGAVATIATTADPDVSSIEFFPPALNADGLVAFRAKDGAGDDAILVGDGDGLAVLVKEHDLVPTDLGAARIDQHDASVVFGGAPAINDRGDVAFAAALAPPDDDQVEWGTGMFVAYADALVGDLDGDGVVGFADLLVLLGAWGPCGPSCPTDLDGDGATGFADLLVLLNAWS